MQFILAKLVSAFPIEVLVYPPFRIFGYYTHNQQFPHTTITNALLVEQEVADAYHIVYKDTLLDSVHYPGSTTFARMGNAIVYIKQKMCLVILHL